MSQIVYDFCILAYIIKHIRVISQKEFRYATRLYCNPVYLIYIDVWILVFILKYECILHLILSGMELAKNIKFYKKIVQNIFFHKFAT